VNFLRTLGLASLLIILSACAEPFADYSRFVPTGPNTGFYILKKGSPLALRLGYTYPPTSDSGSVLHAGLGVDVVAFRFNRAGVLSAPPAYFAQLEPDRSVTDRLAFLRKGVSTWPEIRHLFGRPNWRIKQRNGGMLVYHEISFYDPLQQDLND
jgi:hypothetical protein